MSEISKTQTEKLMDAIRDKFHPSIHVTTTLQPQNTGDGNLVTMYHPNPMVVMGNMRYQYPLSFEAIGDYTRQSQEDGIEKTVEDIGRKYGAQLKLMNAAVTSSQ